uniref:MOFRL-associated domain-containing protein n=1 Tax=Anopheles atroparvus TaxID=41427 RepID=A0A182JA13_ANOAO
MAASRMKALARNMSSDDVLCVLVSGGGSALLCLPKEPVTLAEKLQIIKGLAGSGATIDELNHVRIALSAVKGGQLALAARNAFKVYSYVISDIVGDPVELIASGPTVIDTNTDGLKSVVLSKKIQGNVRTVSDTYVALAELVCSFRSDKLSEDAFKDKIEALFGGLAYDDLKPDEFVARIADSKNQRILIVGAGEPTVCVEGAGKGDGIDGPTDVAGAIGGAFVARACLMSLINRKRDAQTLRKCASVFPWSTKRQDGNGSGTGGKMDLG